MPIKKQDNWNAQYYKKNSGGQYATGLNSINEITFRGDEQVLDLGCGDGRITSEITKHVPNGSVLGIDVSQNMITEAQKNFTDIKNLNFECADATTFSYTEKFDLIVSFSAFHWIKDQQAALTNMYKALKPGGRLIMHVYAVHNNPDKDMYTSEKWAPYLSKKERSFFPQTLDTMNTMLERTGFKTIDIKHEVTLRTFDSTQDIFNWAFAWVPHLTGLPEDKAREFTQDVVDSICESRHDGKLILERARLKISATKPIIK